jgi:hypothetical protein
MKNYDKKHQPRLIDLTSRNKNRVTQMARPIPSAPTTIVVTREVSDEKTVLKSTNGTTSIAGGSSAASNKAGDNTAITTTVTQNNQLKTLFIIQTSMNRVIGAIRHE